VFYFGNLFQIHGMSFLGKDTFLAVNFQRSSQNHFS
jgi:hypothetical protein